MSEEWRQIAGYQGKYEVSSRGRVRSFHGEAWKMLTPYGMRGTLSVSLSWKRKIRQHLVHRLVAEAFVSNPSGKKQVRHFNGKTSDNNASNLYWWSPGDALETKNRSRRASPAN